jgi:hypothetical protein
VAVVLLRDRTPETFSEMEIVLQSGRERRKFPINSRLTLVEMDLSVGMQKVSVCQRGTEILQAAGDIEVTGTPQGIWNYNLSVMRLSRCP